MEQRFLHCIFGILLVTDKGKNPSLGSPSVPPAELSILPLFSPMFGL
jgi:hypothetical protein